MAKVQNIKIRQTWIEEEIEKCAKELNLKEDDGFLYLVSSLLMDCSYADIEVEDVVDGGGDKQIDLIHIEDDQDKGHADILILQAKNATGFSSNTVIQIRNGMDWIFERPKSDLATLKNHSFRKRIEEIRALRSDYGASNLSVHLYHVTNGDKTVLSDEYLQETKTLVDKYSNLGLGEFLFDQLGAHELVELMNEGDRAKRRVDLELPILYDINRASMIEFAQGDTKSFVCTVKGDELAKAASVEPRDSIFDQNVRPYYGSTGKVNKDIWNTCTSTDSSRFWFLNNGITMVCDSFDFTRDTDNPVLKIKNAQIVNGCQTTVTIREAFEKGELNNNVNVLIRVYSTDNPNLVNKITLTTNNQNKITDRDLRANDSVQQDIQSLMEERYGYFYERKNKQHKALRGPNKQKIVPSPKAAQAYLAIIRTKPANAKGYLSAIWSDFYNEIFVNASVIDLLVAYKIYQLCHVQALAASKLNDISATERDCRVYGIFQVARTIGFYLLNDQWGHSNIDKVEKLLSVFENENLPDDIYKKALDIVVEIRKKDELEYPIPALYFKNTLSQRKLNSRLKNG